MRFSLNHSIAPLMPIPDFCALASTVGVDAIELRDGMPPGWEFPEASNVMRHDPEWIASVAADHGLEILSINALQRFDQWDALRADEAKAMIAFAAAAGIRAIVLCPSVAPLGSPALPSGLAEALDGLQPMLQDAGVRGLVEPLGFPRSSIRYKSIVDQEFAVRGSPACLGIVHDSFHHAVASDPDLSANTGLVHLSAVPHLGLALDALGDEHRGLLGPDDVIDNAGQVRRLRPLFDGPWSIEPFASEVGASTTLADDLRGSLAYFSTQVSTVD